MDPFFAANVDILSAKVYDIANSSWGNAHDLYTNFLNPAATAAAKGMLPMILTVEIIFCGFRIMTGKPMIEQMVKILFSSLICYVLLFGNQVVQNQLIAAVQDMRETGMAIGGSIAYSSPELSQATKVNLFLKNRNITPAAAHDLSPMYMWASWVDPDDSHKSPNYKYGFRFIRNRLFADPYNGWMVENSVYELKRYNQVASTMSTMLDPVLPNNRSFFDGLFDWESGFLSKLAQKNADTAVTDAGLLYVMSPMTAFGYAIPIAFTIMAGMLAPLWVTVSVLSATFYSFFIVLSLGTAVVPLLYFSSFADIWKTWLKFLVGIALIPFLYYIFCGIGFIFVTSTFNVLFPDNPASPKQVQAQQPGQANPKHQAGMSEIYGSVLEESVAIAYSASVPDAKSLQNLGDFMSGSMQLFFNIFMILGRQGGGCTIITTFIMAGTAFPIASVKMAHKWSEGFADNAVFESVMEAFQTMQGGVSSAIGQQVSSGMDIAQQAGTKIAGMIVGGSIGGALSGGSPTGSAIGTAIGGFF